MLQQVYILNQIHIPQFFENKIYSMYLILPNSNNFFLRKKKTLLQHSCFCFKELKLLTFTSPWQFNIYFFDSFLLVIWQEIQDLMSQWWKPLQHRLRSALLRIWKLLSKNSYISRKFRIFSFVFFFGVKFSFVLYQ